MTVEQARKEIEYMIKGIKNDVSNFENNNKPPRADLTLANGPLNQKLLY